MADLPGGGYALSVGKPYIEGKTNWPEGVEYNYRGGGHELRLFYRDLTPKEYDAIASGPARFAFAVSGDVIFFCWKFGDLPWADSTFSAWLVPDAERVPPPEWTEPEARALCAVICVETTSGLVAALRAVTFSPDFTRRLHRAIRDQLGRPYPGEDAYMRQCTRVYSAYSSADLARKLAVATCKGGE